MEVPRIPLIFESFRRAWRLARFLAPLVPPTTPFDLLSSDICRFMEFLVSCVLLSSAWLSLHLPFSSTVGFEKFFSAVACWKASLALLALGACWYLGNLPRTWISCDIYRQWHLALGYPLLAGDKRSGHDEAPQLIWRRMANLLQQPETANVLRTYKLSILRS